MSILQDWPVMVDDVNEPLDSLDWSRLGKKVEERRRALGWSREQLAHESGVSSRSIADYEHGSVPTGRYPYKIRAVIHALGWAAGSDLDILHGGEPMGRLDKVMDASDPDDDLVFIMRNVHEAGARSLKAMRAVLESDLERD